MEVPARTSILVVAIVESLVVAFVGVVVVLGGKQIDTTDEGRKHKDERSDRAGHGQA